VTLHALTAIVFHSVWLSDRQRLDYGVTGTYHFDSRLPDLQVFLSWEGSNGRRFVDHTPLEGEDYFFPQRGPGLEPARLGVGK
jgi:hypothetical protein